MPEPPTPADPPDLSIAERFRGEVPRWDRLLEEVLFMLKGELQAREIKIHSVSGRVKDEASFLEKITRKGYEDPFRETDDLVGVRAVCLFRSDLPRLRELVDETFQIVSEEDKVDGPSADTFGYMSVHYVCTLRTELFGPRYHGLTDLRFEVQCRTILMDAWANVSHYLAYKGESSIPERLRRDFHALSGLFYVADRHFELFFDEAMESRRAALVEAKVAKSTDVSIDRDTLYSYLVNRYEDRLSGDDYAISEFVEEIVSIGYRTISDLDAALNRGDAAALVYEQDHPPGNTDRFAAVGIARQSLAIADPAYRELKYSTNKTMEGYEKYLADGDE